MSKSWNTEQLEKNEQELELFIYGLQKLCSFSSVSTEELIKACRLLVDKYDIIMYYREQIETSEEQA